jgi:hypothetical protein
MGSIEHVEFCRKQSHFMQKNTATSPFFFAENKPNQSPFFMQKVRQTSSIFMQKMQQTSPLFFMQKVKQLSPILCREIYQASPIFKHFHPKFKTNASSKKI